MGNLYVSDSRNGVIRILSAEGKVETIPTPKKAFKQPCGIVINSSNDIFVVDSLAHCIKKVSLSGSVSIMAGSENGLSGFRNGAKSQALFFNPVGLALDPISGDLIVADSRNHLIRRVSMNGSVSTIAGSTSGNLDSHIGTDAKFNYPNYVAVNSSGEIYVSDGGNSLVRKIGKDNSVKTVKFRNPFIFLQQNAIFQCPFGIAISPDGRVFVVENETHSIKVFRDSF
jgi:DNA-binding beta-propeller fold protein YncE